MLIELTDFKTKEKVDELEVDAVMVATGRAPFTQVPLLFFFLSSARPGKNNSSPGFPGLMGQLNSKVRFLSSIYNYF